jgi:hypothetical protein
MSQRLVGRCEGRLKAGRFRHLRSGRGFDVSRASWISSAAHTAWTRAVDGASELLLFAWCVEIVGVGRDDGCRRMEW